jgi:hypothetical protein
MPTNFDKLIKERLDALRVIVNNLPLEKNSDHCRNLIKTNWLDFISLMEHLTAKHYKRYNVLNLTTIICGILIPVLINIKEYPEFGRITVTVLGLLVSISAAVSQSYRFNDRWRHFRTIAEELKIEGAKYLSLSEKYKLFDNFEDGFKLFMENVELIKQQQINAFMTKIVIHDAKPKSGKDDGHS